MALVTVDTSVALPATLRPGGMARKFWVLLAFGALSYEAEHRKLDLDALRHEYEAIGGTLGGTQAAEALIAHAETQRAALAAQLPHDVPDDWIAVGSRPLFDEYERKVREIGPRFDPQVDVADAHLLRRQMEAVCVAAAPPPPRQERSPRSPETRAMTRSSTALSCPTLTTWSATTSTSFPAGSRVSTSTRTTDC